MLDLLNSLFNREDSLDDNLCGMCKRRFNCPVDDPEDPQYCLWYLTGFKE